MKSIILGAAIAVAFDFGLSSAQAATCQAEDAYGLLNVDVEASLSGYRGSGYISQRSFKEAGDYIEWKVDVSTAGNYLVAFRYQAPDRKNLTLEINDVAQSTPNPDFVKTTTWASSTFGSYALAKGENNIKLAFGPNGWVDIDEIAVTGPGSVACKSAVRAKVSGRYIKDHNGANLVWRGVNVGWFINFGRDASDAATIKAKGANFVRIVVPWYNDSWDTRNSGSPATCYMKNSALANLDSRINAFTGQGLWVGLAPRSSWGAGDGTFANGSGGEGNFWTNPAIREEYISMYECLVDRYKDIDFIAVWEGLAEPRIDASRKTEVRQFYEEVFDRLEAVDPRRTPFMMGPARYYKPDQLTWHYRIQDRSDVVYTVDQFEPHNYTHQGAGSVVAYSNSIKTQATQSMNNALIFRARQNVPLHINQFGAKLIAPGHLDYDRDMIDLFESLGLSWSYWQWHGGAFAATSSSAVRSLLESKW